MSFLRRNKDEVLTTPSKGGAPPLTTLAAIEALAIPVVQEVVFLADFRCSKCQQRVAEIMSKMNDEDLLRYAGVRGPRFPPLGGSLILPAVDY